MATRFVYATSANAHIKAASRKVIAQATDAIADDARAGAPVDTGALRNSIESQMVEDTGVVSVGVDYGADVELGTSKMRAQPYLKPAAYKRRSL